MTWSAIDKETLIAEMETALSAADDSVRAAWERIRIAPEKWQCSPWGDDGGGFWVVGIAPDCVVWFNDIEGGFNKSTARVRGVIDEYRCNQDDFAQFLRMLPEAEAAETFAANQPANEVPAALTGPGRIGSRQTTHWEIHPDNGPVTRVHFTGKRETRFVGHAFASATVADAHPLLAHHTEQRASVYIKGAAEDPRALLAALEARMFAATNGWRTFGEYGRGESILRDGHGLFLEGPRSVARLAGDVLQAHGVIPSTLDGWQPKGTPRVLILGKSFVVADAFRFAPVA